MTDAPSRRDPHRLCAQPKQRPIVLPRGLAPQRELAIRLIKNKWVAGTVLHYCFVGDEWDGFDDQKQAVHEGFKQWAGIGIGLSFRHVTDPTEAELRIGFDQGDGSWSFVGTDVLKFEDRGRTMNFGWDLTDRWGRATVLHEIGHALGMPHEHQNPNAGIVWNTERVYETYSGSPNFWDRETIFHNILRKLPRSEVEGSDWDPRSIMHYPIDKGLITAPPPYDTEGTPDNVELSKADVEWILRFYPPPKEPAAIETMELAKLAAEPAGQADFEFSPDATRDYTIRTVGPSDVKVVLFEERDGEPRHLASEDDSGADENAEITTKLIKGRHYVIRARTHFAGGPSAPGLVIT